MFLYAFELGRKKKLCLAELIAVLGKDRLIETNLDTAIFKMEKLESDRAQSLQNVLGGTIKIVELWDDNENPSTKPKIDYEAAQQHISKQLETRFSSYSGKFQFAISTLSFKDHHEINIKKLLNFSKFFLKSLNLNSRFVNKNFLPPKPSTIYKARVLEKGIDINIIKGEKQIYLGHTVAIQDIDAYSYRDFDKPKRDAHNGMLPPKLAQIMINLAGKSDTIYDPFCGTGTVLTEGLLMGKNVVGSDIEPRMAEFSQENINWLIKGFQIENPAKSRIFVKDARFLIAANLIPAGGVAPEKVDAIVTEGYLGNPQSQVPSPTEVEKTFRELANLHLNWLRALHPLTPRHCRVVMCVAAFRTNKGYEFLPKFDQLAQTAGYKVKESYIYDREDQIVAREIKVLEKI